MFMTKLGERRAVEASKVEVQRDRSGTGKKGKTTSTSIQLCDESALEVTEEGVA